MFICYKIEEAPLNYCCEVYRKLDLKLTFKKEKGYVVPLVIQLTWCGVFLLGDLCVHYSILIVPLLHCSSTHIIPFNFF